mgnify:CR=1 FL=1
MRRAGRWKTHIAERNVADARQNILPVRRLRLGAVEKDRTDPVMRSKEALKVIRRDGAVIDACIQTADSCTRFQYIP